MLTDNGRVTPNHSGSSEAGEADLLASIASKEVVVAAISVRDLDETVRERLRVRAARNGRSMEAEIREILTAAVSEPEPRMDLFVTLLERFGELGGVDMVVPARTSPARAADFSA